MKPRKLGEDSSYRVQYIFRPGRNMTDARLGDLVEKLRDCASTCFSELPEYQVMMGSRPELDDKVLAVAWRADGKIAGFCSTVLLAVPGVGDILHLGLTCVRPTDRHRGLTHILTKKAVAGYLIRRKPVGKLWISNCAAVLSSLGNVALHFEDVYPSPVGKNIPTLKHIQIAQTIERNYRAKMCVDDNAIFDYKNFVFRGSIEGTVFQKDADDRRFHHRKKGINDFYQNLMDFQQGDEVLQIGFVSTFTAMKYQLLKKRRQQKLLIQDSPAA